MAHPGMLFAELGFPVTPMLPHILARAFEATDFRPSRFLTQSPSHQVAVAQARLHYWRWLPALWPRSSLTIRTSIIGVAS